jgi:hypothetical protein
LRWAAYGYRNIDQREAALVILRRLLEHDPDSDLFRLQVAQTLRGLGDYQGLRDHLAQYGLKPETNDHLNGYLLYDAGDLVSAAAASRRRAAAQRARGQHRLDFENRADELWRLALAGVATVDECEAYVAEADRFGQRLHLCTGLAAWAVVTAGDQARYAQLHRDMRRVLATSELPDHWRERAVALVHASRVGDLSLLLATRTGWTQSPATWTPQKLLIDRLFVHLGFPRTLALIVPDPQAATEIEARWSGHLTRLTGRPPATSPPDGPSPRSENPG